MSTIIPFSDLTDERLKGIDTVRVALAGTPSDFETAWTGTAHATNYGSPAREVKVLTLTVADRSEFPKVIERVKEMKGGGI
jgi:hypothetical protein